MFRKSNPISYKLRAVVDRHAVDLHLKALRKQVVYIFRSFMKRMRAAYAFRVKQLNASTALREDTKQHELRMWASACSDQEEEINTLFNQITDALTPTKWKATYRGTFDVRNFDTIANANIDDCNKGIRTGEDWVKRIEERGHKAMRNLAKDKSGFTEREHEIYQTRIYRKNLTALMLELKENYPYIREKYRTRLAKLIFAFIQDERKHGGINRGPKSVFHAPNYTMTHLVKIGIPAADVVGPWWPRVDDIKSPMGFIDWVDTTCGEVKIDGEIVRYYEWKSPDEKSWLTSIGLDWQDARILTSVRHYYRQHGAVPSATWARRRSNELEEERKQQEMIRQVKPVTEFLKASARALKACTIGVPPLQKEWRIVKPEDAKELCERAQRDGLCVVDAVSRLVTDSDDEEDWLDRCNREGVCTLLFSIDPNCRTIVGLDGEGKCTSEHHCTGRDNEVDEEAWERFK
jgi:hypothetical protein